MTIGSDGQIIDTYSAHLHDKDYYKESLVAQSLLLCLRSKAKKDRQKNSMRYLRHLNLKNVI